MKSLQERFIEYFKENNILVSEEVIRTFDETNKKIIYDSYGKIARDLQEIVEEYLSEYLK